MAWEGAYNFSGTTPPPSGPALTPDGLNYNGDVRAIKPQRIEYNGQGSGGLSSVIMLCEGNYNGVDWSFYQNDARQASTMQPYGRRLAEFDQITFRHYQDYTTLNALYFDGHVESVNYKNSMAAFQSMLTWPDPYIH